MKTILTAIKKCLYYVSIAIVIIIVMLFSSLIAANVYLTNSRVAQLLTSQIESRLNADVSLRVEDFSLFSGLEVNSVSLFAKGYSQPVVKVDRFIFRYRLLPILIGKINVHELGIYNPEIFIEEKNGNWNIHNIIKPSAEDEKKEKEKDKKEKADTDAISLPIPVEIFFKFVVEDLSLTVQGERFTLKCNDLSSYIDMHIPPTRHIPLHPMALALFDTLKIKINPDKRLEVSYVSKDIQAGPSLLFTFNLIYEPEEKKLLSNFICGTENSPIRFVKKHAAPLNAKIEYDVEYNPLTDSLYCTIFRITFNRSTWISFAGSINDVNTRPRISFAMLDSNIRLDEIYGYTSRLLGKKPYFSGTVSLFPLSITGDNNETVIQGAISGQRLAVASNGFAISIPSINIPYLVKFRNPIVDASVEIAVPHFVYTVGENRSKDNGARLLSRVAYNLDAGLLDIRTFTITHKAPGAGANTIECSVTGSVQLGGTVKAALAFDKVMINIPLLARTMPVHLNKLLASYPITQPITAHLMADIRSNAERQDMHIRAAFAVPDYSIHDATVAAAISLLPLKEKITVARLELSSTRQYIHAFAQGDIVTKDALYLDIEGGIAFTPKTEITFGDYTMSGMLDADAQIKGNVASMKVKGNLASNELRIVNNANHLYVGPVDMDIPIEYTMGESINMTFDAVDALDSKFIKPSANFSLGKVAAAHPSRPMAFEYVQNCSGFIGFKRNVMEIKNLRATVMGGTVSLKALQFNLADLNPENMEYRIALNAHDIDIGRLDRPEAARIHKESLLSLTAQVQGRSLNFERNVDVNGTINIYKVGEQFANRLFKGLNEERGTSKLGMAQFAVDNTLVISGFDFYMNKGLVYPTVIFSKKRLGILVTVENEKVRYERIPISELFMKAREETI